MIARVWHGRISRENVAAYVTMLTQEVLPGIHRIDGFRGAQVLERDAGDEMEIVTITYFDSLEAVRAFAGTDYTLAVVLPEARALLSRFDERAVHYETIFSTGATD